MKRLGRISSLLLLSVFLFGVVIITDSVTEARAEYGDIVMNNFSDDGEIGPAVFPHWFHRIRYRCKVCHTDLGFKFEAGGTQTNMEQVFEGKYCGACHDGQIAWSVENCALCHTGKAGAKSQVFGSSGDILVTPAK